MGNEYGYWIPLAGKTFGETDEVKWIQAMPVGKFEHPVYGTIEFTPEKLQRFAANVKANVRGQELDIDYDHKDKTGEAAGWVQDAKFEDNKLMLAVKWTASALQKIKEGAYKYFSPEFDDEWTDAQGNKHQDVLFGGGLTNRPFLKNMMPVNLSELTFSTTANPTPTPTPPAPPAPPTPPKGVNMTLNLKDVLAKIGLDETASEVDIAKRCDELMQLKAAQDGTDPLAGPALKVLAEQQPALRALIEAHEASQARLAELEKAKKLTEANDTVRRLASMAESQVVVAPAIKDQLVHLFAELTGKHSDDLKDVVRYFVTGKGIVQLGEQGFARTASGTDEDDPTTAFMAYAQRLMSERGLKDINQAFAIAAQEKPHLYMAYRQGAYAFREN